MKKSRTCSNNGGFTLVITLIAVTLIIVIITQVQFASRVEFTQSKNHVTTLQSAYVAQGVAPLVIEKLKKDLETNAIDSQDDMWAKEMHALLLNDGKISVDLKVFDEDGKYNLNQILDDQGKVIPEKREELLRLIKAFEFDYQEKEYEALRSDDDFIDRILDYMDADEVGTFENDKVNSNRPLLALDELLQVDGITPKLLYGSDPMFVIHEVADPYDDEPYEDINHKYDEDEEKPPFLGLFNYLTVAPRGNTSVNINTAAREVFMALSDKATKDFADAVIAYRDTTKAVDDTAPGFDPDNPPKEEHTPFMSVNDLLKIDFDKTVTQAYIDELNKKTNKDQNNNNNNQNQNQNDGQNQGNGQNQGDGQNQGGQSNAKNPGRLKVSSSFFRVIIRVSVPLEEGQTGKPDESLYTAVFYRTNSFTEIQYWNRTSTMPGGISDENKGDANARSKYYDKYKK